MKNDTIRKIVRIALSVTLVVAGVCLMAACFTLYRTGGNEPYSAQRIAQYWKPIAIFVYLALAMVVVSFVVEAVLPAENKRRPVEKNYPLMLKKLHEKNDLSGCGDKNLVAAIEAEQKKRKLHQAITWALLAVGFVSMLCYGLNSQNVYSAQADAVTGKILRYAIVMLICFGVPFGYGVFCAYFQKASIRREWELMELVAAPRNQPLQKTQKQYRWLAYVPYVGIAVAVVLIVVGYLGDGQIGVLEKAIEICKECVGIG